eukprot:CAMPEP_0119516832 /NCGR_PEP_ID=MMETSP1344-20130328/33916_1 /TAXON_ID=236787 /ORGANISM="Florenciella parvula, Strain CCMP2471" /LENGTH=58 /DNA_ID=CAMNT_0007554367 /DNA_START=15 /DNA_END=188 /DNA_ORIENTATION=+
MQPPPLIAKAFGVNWQKIVEVANSAFIKKLVKMVNDELKKQGNGAKLVSSHIHEEDDA